MAFVYILLHILFLFKLLLLTEWLFGCARCLCLCHVVNVSINHRRESDCEDEDVSEKGTENRMFFPKPPGTIYAVLFSSLYYRRLGLVVL